jgi:hypothetical protein
MLPASWVRHYFVCGCGCSTGKLVESGLVVGNAILLGLQSSLYLAVRSVEEMGGLDLQIEEVKSRRRTAELSIQHPRLPSWLLDRFNYCQRFTVYTYLKP